MSANMNARSFRDAVFSRTFAPHTHANGTSSASAVAASAGWLAGLIQLRICDCRVRKCRTSLSPLRGCTPHIRTTVGANSPTALHHVALHCRRRRSVEFCEWSSGSCQRVRFECETIVRTLQVAPVHESFRKILTVNRIRQHVCVCVYPEAL